jgi:hypothetical protein
MREADAVDVRVWSIQMNRTALIVALGLGGFVAGYAAGHRTTFGWTLGMLSAETQGNLVQGIETLARLRTGDTDGAIALLEDAVDTATMNLPQGTPWSQLEANVRSALQLSKAYRTVYPPADSQTELAALLTTVPMPDLQYCSPALQTLLRQPRGPD